MSSNPPEARRWTRRRWLTVGCAAGVAVAMAASAAVVGGHAWVASRPWHVVGSRGGYDLTADQQVVAGQPLAVPLDAGVALGGAVEVYRDAALTSRVTVGELTAGQAAATGYRGRTGAGRRLLVTSGDPTGEASCTAAASPDRVHPWTCDAGLQVFQHYRTGAWGMFDRYWLVRRVDQHGQRLAHPVLTAVVVERAGAPAAPQVRVGLDAQGTVTLDWSAVAGATSYRVVLWSVDARRRSLATPAAYVVASVRGTHWAASTVTADGAVYQNAELRFAGTPSADELPLELDASRADVARHLCVVATDGTRWSACTDVDASVVGHAPYTAAVADLTVGYRAAHGARDVLAQLPTSFVYVALDGTLRSVAAHIDPASFSSAGGTRTVTVTGQGTALSLPVSDQGIAVEAIAAFDTRADHDGAGRVGVTTSVATSSVVGGSSAAPAVDYPVFATSDLVEFLARALVAHVGVIDASAYVGRAGEPSVNDAMNEAITQNPYAMVDGFDSDGGTVHVTYTYSRAEQAALDQQVHDVVTGVVAAVTTPSMSATAKVTALNDWLTAHADYDDAALDAYQALRDPSALPAGKEYAWDASGVLLRGLGVCESYAEAFDLLANAAGVPTVAVTGYLLDGDAAHEWDKVQVGGVWRDVDVTWDDGPPVSHRYLLVRDDQLTGEAARRQDHFWMTDSRIADYATR